MSFIDNVLMALSNIRANKMRSVLTMLGIIIGIGSVIAIMTVGDSLSGSISESLSSMGITNITVSITNKDSDNDNFARMFQRASYSEKDLISNEMIDEYRNAYGQYIDSISLTESVGSQTISNGANSGSVSISGVNVDYKKANDVELVTGRWINETDLEENRKVCVVSDYLVEKLGYSTMNAIGKEVEFTIGNHIQKFYISGIYKYEEESSVSFFSSNDTQTSLYIPVTTAKYWSKSNKGYSSFTVSSTTDVDADEFLTATQKFFASYYTRNDTYTVNASNMSSMIETMTSMMSTITLAISAIAGISLIVGGIGVMNIMLVSITERTREIGTRKSLGASSNVIRVQFIVEAMIICMIGGFIGVILGVSLGVIAAKLIGYSSSVSIPTCVLAVGFSMAVGIFFGYYPANKAAKMNPIDALRYE